MCVECRSFAQVRAADRQLAAEEASLAIPSSASGRAIPPKAASRGGASGAKACSFGPLVRLGYGVQGVDTGTQAVGSLASRATATVTPDPSTKVKTTEVPLGTSAGQNAPEGQDAGARGGTTRMARSGCAGTRAVAPAAAPVQSTSDMPDPQVNGNEAVAGSRLGGGEAFGASSWTWRVPIMSTIHISSDGPPSRGLNVTQDSPLWGGPMHGLALGHRLIEVAVTALMGAWPEGSCRTA